MHRDWLNFQKQFAESMVSNTQSEKSHEYGIDLPTAA
jgi:hypothetical protein